MIPVSKFFRFAALTAVSVPLLMACGGSDDDSFDDRADVADPKVRFVHAVPAGPSVTLRRNGVDEPNASGVTYETASQYYDVGTENYTFTLVTSGTGTEVATTSFGTDRGNKYTLVALPTTSGVELLSIRDPYNKSLTSNDTRVRVLHAVPGAAAVDVYLTAPGVSLTTVSPSFASITYRQAAPASGGDSIEIAPSTYQVRLTESGSKTAIYSTTVQVPEDGDWLLIALPDVSAPGGVQLLRVRSDDSSDATDVIVSD
jgi:hypothetical protein